MAPRAQAGHTARLADGPQAQDSREGIKTRHSRADRHGQSSRLNQVSHRPSQARRTSSRRFAASTISSIVLRPCSRSIDRKNAAPADRVTFIKKTHNDGRDLSFCHESGSPTAIAF
jgi:hypothetical protein